VARRVTSALLVLAIAFASSLSAGDSVDPTTFEFLGELSLPPEASFEGEPVGGLSGLVWHADRGLFAALSDDRGEHGSCRFYDLRLALDHLDAPAGDGIEVVAVHHLTGREGMRCPQGGIDPEGFAPASGGGYFLSSEGVVERGVQPFVARLGEDGREVSRLALPDRYLSDGSGRRGVRSNLAFESLTVSPDGRFLVAGLENALLEDGPAADVGVDSPARLLAWRLEESGPPCEYAYEVDPVSRPPGEPEGFRVNGLVDLLALGDDRLLALEREWVSGVGHRIQLFLVRLDPPLSARFGSGSPSLGRTVKRRLIDFSALGRPLENFEGMAFGPRLGDGRRSLVIVSDDNFDTATQRTRFFVFAVDDSPLSVARIQGASHRSPLAGQWVAGVGGVVTGIDRSTRRPGFYLESESPDADPATSDGLRVDWADATKLTVGDRIVVDGRVEEKAPGASQLSVTTLVATAVTLHARGVGLPPAVKIGADRRVPRQIDDDGLTRYEPTKDAIDFWESLEGMRVLVDGRRVTGPTLGYDELVLALDQDESEPTSDAGGNLLTPRGPALDRVILAGRLVGGLPRVAVGSRIAAPIEGIVDYSFSNYKLLLTRPLEVESAAAICRVKSRLEPDPARIRIATFNVENFSVADAGERLAQLGTTVALRLGSPEIVALEEVQDDSGKRGGDGVVTSRATLEALVDAIVAAGGPRYESTVIDPELDREGGVPGGNIRVALLTLPPRVTIPRRGSAGPLDAVGLVGKRSGLRFEPNPARVAPTSSAFSLRFGEGVRRSLAVEAEVDGRPWFFVVNHWSSKYEDGRPFGAIQPAPTPTATRRLAQAEVVRDFATDLLAKDPEARLVVLGDLNDVPWSPPVERLGEPPLVNLLLRAPEATRYSYNFEGSAQLIDHVVVSPALAGGAEIEFVHLNSNCPENLRTSDHDPVVASFPSR